jgi:glycosyltransferase involved in cell wall biosynthesis
VFFTYPLSLQNWAEAELLDRELGLYRALIAEGVRVTFVTYGTRSDLEYSDRLGQIALCPAYAGRRRPRTKLGGLLGSLLLPFRLGALVRDASILKTNQLWGAWVALLCGALYRRPVIVRCGVERYQNELREPHPRAYLFALRLISAACYRAATSVVVTTPSIAEFITARLHVDRAKIHVLPNYVDVSTFCPLDLPENGRILFVGRLSPVKNLSTLIEAVACTGYGLDIIGEGRARVEIERQVAALNADVRLLGRVRGDRLPELINRYSVFVLPSWYEGHPKALIEAMACGAAVIGTNVPGIRTVIEHQRTGLLAEPNAKSLSEAITSLMGDRALRRTLGAAARTFAVQHFALRTLAARELALYRALLDAWQKAEAA